MLEHIGKSAAAIVKPAEYIDQGWSGMVFEDNEQVIRERYFVLTRSVLVLPKN